jgi:hypothetical protein
MTIAQIHQSIEGVIRFYAEHPEKAQSTDKAAVAVIQGGLRCKAEGPDGAVLITDMPKGIGGGGAAPTPGWFLRARTRKLRRNRHCDARGAAWRCSYKIGGYGRQSLGQSRTTRGRRCRSSGAPQYARSCTYRCRRRLTRTTSSNSRVGGIALTGRRCGAQGHTVQHGDRHCLTVVYANSRDAYEPTTLDRRRRR